MNPGEPVTEAVAISRGRFFAVGKNADVMNLGWPGARKLDLGGKTVLPGFIDSHSHPAAAEVLANRYGDCKDKTTLLEAMLEAVGLHASPALVNLGADVDPEMPNPMQFDHAIAVLRIGGRDTWLDTTLGVGPFGYLMPQLRNTQALVIAKTAATGLRKMPQEFPFNPEYRIGIEGTIDKQGILDASVELKTRGDLEVLIRLLNDHLAKDQLAKTADSVLSRTNKILYGSVRYSDFKVANPAEISLPVKAQFHVSGKLMFVDPNATPARITVALSSVAISQLRVLSLLPAIDAKTDSNNKGQPRAMQLKGPGSYSLTLNLTFPDLPRSDLPPAQEFQLSQEFAEFNSRDSWEGRTLNGSKSLDLRSSAISASHASEYATFVKSIAEALATSPEPNVESKAAPTPPKPQPVEARHVAAADVQDSCKRGEDESKRKNWANAIEAFGSATKADPQYPEAWRELGRAHMYAHEYSDAEISFRRYLELAPNDHLAYLNMAWVLFNEKKFDQERDLMLQRIAVAPNDGDALFRLGTAYLALHQPAQAVPVLERSVAQFPKYVAAQLSLARAYLETHEELLAQLPLRKAVALDDSETMLNSVAYLHAEHSVFLDLAEGWSQRSIDVVEKELNSSTISNVQSRTWTLVAKVSHYWDTMGWIKFQQHKMDTAEKYVLAAWQIADDLIIDFHLGRIYEAQDRKNDAVQMYLAALNSVPPSGPLGDTAKEACLSLVDLLGGDSQVEERLAQARRKKSTLRMVNIANPAGEQGIAQYTVMIDTNFKVAELRATNSDDPLASLHEAIRTATMPQTFPDTTLKKMPRLTTLACTGSDQPCSLTLLSPGAASRFAPLD
jgi:tetratricopeptide (TPR) repeat protein